MSVRIDRLQEGLFTVLSDFYGSEVSVFWAHNEPSREQLKSNLLSLEVLSGPTKVYQTRPRGQAFIPPTNIVLTIVNAIEDELYQIYINNIKYSYTAVFGDTVDTIRDALVSIVEADEYKPCTISATLNAGEFEIIPNSFAEIYQCSINQNITLTTLVLSSSAALFTRGVRQFVVSLQAFSKNKNPRNGSQYLMDRFMDLSEMKTYSDLLWGNYGISLINVSSPVDLTAIAGASWESRSSIDLTINLDSGVTEPTESLEGVSFSVSLQNGTQPIDFNFND